MGGFIQLYDVNKYLDKKTTSQGLKLIEINLIKFDFTVFISDISWFIFSPFEWWWELLCHINKTRGVKAGIMSNALNLVSGFCRRLGLNPVNQNNGWDLKTACWCLLCVRVQYCSICIGSENVHRVVLYQHTFTDFLIRYTVCNHEWHSFSKLVNYLTQTFSLG